MSLIVSTNNWFVVLTDVTLRVRAFGLAFNSSFEKLRLGVATLKLICTILYQYIQ